MTLCIVERLYFKVGAFSSARPHQFQQPAPLADATHRQGLGLYLRHPPARRSRRWGPEIPRLGLPPPPAHSNAHGAGRLGRKLEALRRFQAQMADLSDHGAQPAMSKRILETSQYGGLLPALEKHNTIRR